MRNVLMAMSVLAISLFTGCGEDNAEKVKNGTLKAYPQTTIGMAFQFVFEVEKWEEFEDKGRKKVRFSGKIPRATHDTMAEVEVPKLNFLKGPFAEFCKPAVEQRRKQLSQQRKEQEARVKEANQARHICRVRFLLLRKSKRDLEMDSDSDSVEFAKMAKEVLGMSPEKKKDADKQNDIRTDEMIERLANEEKKLKEIDRLLGTVQKDVALEQAAAYATKHIWPVGSTVEFVWVIHTNGQDFEFDSFANEGWAKAGVKLEDVIKEIFELSS